MVVLAIVSVSMFGLNLGIDFKGGALTEVTYTKERPSLDLVNNTLNALGIGSVLVQPTGEMGYLIKTKDLAQEEHEGLLKALSFEDKHTFSETSFNSIGPSVGKELSRKALLSIILVSLGIIIFIAFSFRKVSKPIASWKYGVIAVVTLLHDVIIPIGLFAFFSKQFGVEADTLLVVAVLTILGLSVSDTIVIFDRIRENLRIETEEKKGKFDFKEIVGHSLSQSYIRSLITSLTLIFVLISLFVLGPVTTKYFALMLIAGMFFGTYSSICLSSPLLVLLEEKSQKSK